MITRIKEAKSLSSSSAFIIIIVLVVVSVAAIVVGGGDGFSRKFAGIDFREFSGKMLLAQTGVVGKILEFEESGDGFTLNLQPIELDGDLLEGEQKYATTVVPPREGDTPFSYRPEEGLQITQGYPLLREYVEQNNLNGTTLDGENGEIPSIPGVVSCHSNEIGGGFTLFFEDIAYDTGIGFDDPEFGVSRQTEICSVMQEFENILLLDQNGLHPSIVVQSSREGTPEHALSVVSPQYVGGSGFVSTLLADYLRSGIKRSKTSFSDNVSVLGVNSGFMRFNFINDTIDWSVDTGNSADYDIKTVTRQNMLRLLGFGSFLGHEQENILSSSWKRWTEWDRLLFTDEGSLINTDTLAINSVDYNNFNPGSAENYDSRLISEDSPIKVFASGTIPDIFDVSGIQGVNYNLTTYEIFQKGVSIAGLADPGTVSYPIIGPGESKMVNQAEKEILCMLGLAVEGVSGCDEGPRTVTQDIYIERQNNKTVCINIDQGLYNSTTGEFQLANELGSTIHEEVFAQTVFMYDTPCPGQDFASPAERDSFYENNGTTNLENVKSFSWSPSESESLYREYVQFNYQVKDVVSGRTSDTRTVAIHKCVVTSNSNQLCNGDFQFSGASSPVDYKLSSLVDGIDNDENSVIGCESTTMPGWCAQGVQDGFSSEFGYTWHPYLINNPEAFDSDIVDSPRRYAGGSTGALIQRLRVPLQPNTPYLVSGRVYVTEDGLQPTFWYGSEGSILRQPDGTYHIDYPEALVEATGSIPTEYVLTSPLESGEWHTFSWTLNPGSQPVTHVAFGGSNNNGFILYDDLSIQHITECGDCFSDGNGDCVTNITDLLDFLGQFGGECSNDTIGCTGDLTFDGTVNTSDILLFLTEFGGTCFVDEPLPEDVVENPEPEVLEDSGDSTVSAGDTNYVCIRPDCYSDDIQLPTLSLTKDGVDVSESLEIKFELLEREETIPNSGGFTANYILRIKNITGYNLSDVHVIGALPAMMEYGRHVSTIESLGYDRTTNSIVIPKIERGRELFVYFQVDLNSSICAEIKRQTGAGYSVLISLDLCDSYQTLLERQYGIERDKYGNLIRKGSSTGRNSEEESGEPEAPPAQCSDGLDNDSDTRIDYPNDPQCNSAADNTENVDDRQCSDGVDNDGDGKVDYPEDPQCSSLADNSESL